MGHNLPYVTLHGKTGKKVMTRARMRWHGTLSVLFDTHMCIFNKQNNVTVAFVWHDLTRKTFVQVSVLHTCIHTYIHDLFDKASYR